MTDTLIVEREGGVATLTFNRPDVLNALSLEMRDAIHAVLTEIEDDDTIRCVVLRGAGGNFMAGGDVKGFDAFVRMPAEERQRIFERRVHTINHLFMTLQRMEKPVIASVAGAAAGAGMSMMMASDLAVAADNAVFRMSYTVIGASPDGSGTYTMPRLIGVRRAMEMAMLAERIDAATALQWGLVNRVVPAEQLQEETDRLAARLASGATVALGSVKRLMNASLSNGIETQLAMEARSFGRCVGTDDWAEGVQAFNEKRKPAFRGR